MKKFLSILLSCSLVCGNVFATDTSKSENSTSKINKKLMYGLISGSTILGVTGVTLLSVLLKKNHDKKKEQQKQEIKRQREEARRREEEEFKRRREEEEFKRRREEEEFRRREEEEEFKRLKDEESKRQREQEKARRSGDELRHRIEQDSLPEELETLLLPESSPNCKFTPAQRQFIADKRAPAADVKYEGKNITSLPHVILDANGMRKYFELFQNAPILFRGVHVKDAEQYYSDILHKGLSISSTGDAKGGNAYGDTSDVGKRVYFSPDPSYSFKYSLADGGGAKWKIAEEDTHCMYLASFLPTTGKDSTQKCSDICTGLPKDNGRFVLCMSYYSFNLPPGIKYTESDEEFLINYDPLPPNASQIKKAIRGLQLWLLEAGIVIKSTGQRYPYCKCKYDTNEADKYLQDLKSQAA